MYVTRLRSSYIPKVLCDPNHSSTTFPEGNTTPTATRPTPLTPLGTSSRNSSNIRNLGGAFSVSINRFCERTNPPQRCSLHARARTYADVDFDTTLSIIIRALPTIYPEVSLRVESVQLRLRQHLA